VGQIVRQPNLVALKKSVLFAASLSSKELFHSNILSFFIEKYPELANELFGGSLGRELKVSREEKHADLVIPGNGREIVVENKFKDVAKPSQLHEIESRFPKATDFFLLSLLGENIHPSKIENWKEIPYRKMMQALSNLKPNDDYHKLIIKDYLENLEILISELSPLAICEEYDFYRTGNPSMEEWKAYRLHDVYMKYGLSKFEAYAEANIRNCSSISITTSINNSKPTITFKFSAEAATLCIQIEDIQYRRAMIGDHSRLSKLEEIEWFDQNFKSSKKLKYLKYREDYNNNFYYQTVSHKLQNKSFRDILSLVTEDLKKFSSDNSI